jgi:predicted nucleic acid-binding protein
MPRKAIPATAVVLDANVLVQAPVRDTLLRLAEEPALYRPLWSVEIIAEVRQTLQNKFHIEPHRTARLEAALLEHFPEAWVDGYQSLLPKMKNDLKDRHVLAVAAQSKSRLLVTYNLRHFPPSATKPWGVSAIGPSTLLKSLYSRDRQRVLDVLREQAADIRRTLDEQLNVLQVAVPAFVNTVRRDLGGDP